MTKTDIEALFLLLGGRVEKKKSTLKVNYFYCFFNRSISVQGLLNTMLNKTGLKEELRFSLLEAFQQYPNT